MAFGFPDFSAEAGHEIHVAGGRSSMGTMVGVRHDLLIDAGRRHAQHGDDGECRSPAWQGETEDRQSNARKRSKEESRTIERPGANACMHLDGRNMRMSISNVRNSSARPIGSLR
jgi:hypothetical protein